MPVGGEGIERPVIERQRDAAVTDLRQQGESFEGIVIREPVGVVAQKHGAIIEYCQKQIQERICVAIRNTCSKTLHKKQNRRVKLAGCQTSLA